MGLYEASLIARRAGEENRMRSLLTEALKLECAAADSVADDRALEPTRALLHRSAVSLALQVFDTKTARRYVNTGLEGEPPAEIKSELERLSEQVTILDAETTSYALKAPVGLTPVQRVIRRFNSEPPTDIVGLANALGLTVIVTDLGDDAGEISRDVRRGGFSGYSIRVNQRDARVRQRFTIAHEVAHFLRHRDRVQNRLRDDSMYRSDLGTTVENEANALAADLLMPRQLIAKLRNSGIRDVRTLASKFNVSVEAMERRLGVRRR